MQISNIPSLPTPARSSNSSGPTPGEPAPPPDAFKTSPPQEPGLMKKVAQAGIAGGTAASGLMIATAVGTAFKGAMGGFLSPLLGAGIGALAGGVVATQRAKHQGVSQSESTNSVLAGVAAGAALGAASTFPALMLPAWGLGLVGGGAAEFF